MKKLYFIFCILITFDSLAQTSVYHPFPDSNAVWNVETVAQCSTSLGTWEWKSYIINGDTIIGGSSYHKIHIPLFIDSSQCFGNSTSHGVYIGGVREDTVLRRVFFIQWNTTQEELLYDFNMQVGDTLHGLLTNYGDCADDSVITEMDSVFINGNYRKRWKIPTALMPQYIIEGIGYVGGPFTPICSWEGHSALSCFTQDNIVLYVDSFDVVHPGLCGIINSVSDNERKTSLQFYPIPVNDVAMLETTDVPALLKIYNALGSLVMEQKIVSEKTLLKLEDLQKGIYYYTMNNSSLLQSTGRFIKGE